MVTCYLHIGTHKTGTTSLQSFLASQRELLLSKGYLYPQAGCGQRRKNDHTRLARSLTDDQYRDPASGIWETELKQDWPKLTQEIQATQAHTVVISAERFCLLDSTAIRKLKNRFLSEYQVKIIVYLRRQDDYFCSMYSQDVKSPSRYGKGFQTYLQERISQGNYQQLLEPWAATFGVDNILVKSYRKSCRQPGLIPSFLDAIALDFDPQQFEIPPHSNVTPETKVIKVIQRCHAIAEQLHQRSLPTKRLRDLYLGVLKNPNHPITQAITHLPDSILSAEFMPQDQRTELLESFTTSNQTVAQTYLSPEERPLFS